MIRFDHTTLGQMRGGWRKNIAATLLFCNNLIASNQRVLISLQLTVARSFPIAHQLSIDRLTRLIRGFPSQESGNLRCIDFSSRALNRFLQTPALIVSSTVSVPVEPEGFFIKLIILIPRHRRCDTGVPFINWRSKAPAKLAQYAMNEIFYLIR